MGPDHRCHSQRRPISLPKHGMTWLSFLNVWKHIFTSYNSIKMNAELVCPLRVCVLKASFYGGGNLENFAL